MTNFDETTFDEEDAKSIFHGIWWLIRWAQRRLNVVQKMAIIVLIGSLTFFPLKIVNTSYIDKWSGKKIEREIVKMYPSLYISKTNWVFLLMEELVILTISTTILFSGIRKRESG